MRRALRRFAWWRASWLAAVLAVVVISLLSPPPLPAPPGSDKLLHVLAYFGLMAFAVQLYTGARTLAAIAITLAALGLGLEFAQGVLTADRQMELADAVANAFGVLLGLALAATPAARALERLEGWLE